MLRQSTPVKCQHGHVSLSLGLKDKSNFTKKPKLSRRKLHSQSASAVKAAVLGATISQHHVPFNIIVFNITIQIIL